MEKEEHQYLKDLFKHQDKNKLLTYFNHIIYLKFKQPPPPPMPMLEEIEEPKTKCLYCKIKMAIKPNSNVCSEECAAELTKKIVKKLEKKEEKKRRKIREDWKESPYYSLVKDFEEKVVGEHDKKSNIELYLEDMLWRNNKEKNELKMALINDCCKVSQCCKIPKGWGHELIIHNCEEYCGKILVFKKGCKFSMHYHILKQETWYVNKGSFTFIYIDTEKAITHKRTLNVGDVVTIKRGMPHQLLALQEGEIFEISTEHFDSDSYRISKGN
jgi:mannose-6-phosphate isomerase-like protein (cupin superfamily)